MTSPKHQPVAAKKYLQHPETHRNPRIFHPKSHENPIESPSKSHRNSIKIHENPWNVHEFYPYQIHRKLIILPGSHDVPRPVLPVASCKPPRGSPAAAEQLRPGHQRSLPRESSRSARPGAFKAPMFLFLRSNTHRIHGAAFSMVCHGSHRYTPVMLAYIPAPWILWDINLGFTIWLWLTVRHRKSTHAIKNGAYHLFRLGPFRMAMLVITRPGIRFIY